jgi:ABC-type transport system involved in cytochrome c biogenesis ATPase subunit
MLDSLDLCNYRGFKSLKIRRFSRVNLIGGVNNAGKTGLLEAIYLLLQRKGQTSKEQLPGLFRAKNGISDDLYFWRWIARNGDKNTVSSIQGNVNLFGSVQAIWEDQHSNISREGQPLFNAGGHRFVTKSFSKEQLEKWPTPEGFSPRPTSPVEDAQVYIRATKQNADAEERIEELLREIDDRVKRVRAFPDESTNKPLLHIGLQTGPALPAPQFGQGFNRLLRIYSAILAAEARVFLIDEMETGLHHSVLPLFWKGLAALARREEVQIFATTHSREAIFAAHRVFSEEPNYDFAYHRLERDGQGDIVAMTYDREALEGADEANFEVR